MQLIRDLLRLNLKVACINTRRVRAGLKAQLLFCLFIGFYRICLLTKCHAGLGSLGALILSITFS